MSLVEVDANIHRPWEEHLCAINQLMAKILQSTLEQRQTDLDAAKYENHCFDLLREPVRNFLKLAHNQNLLPEVQALFEESLKNADHISNLPVENTCWCIGDWEYFPHPDGNILRLMAVMDMSTSQPSTQLISLAYKSDMSYEEQAKHLLCRACFHPARKQPRRPYCVKLLDTPGARDVILEVDKFGVNFLNSKTSADWEMLVQGSHVWFHRCFNCGLSGTPEMFITCSQCKAVMYCDPECQMESWNSRHKTWCNKFKTYMQMEHRLAELPFTFSHITTSQNFTRHRFRCFLQENDLYNNGLWRRECPLAGGPESAISFGELLSPHRPYALPLESAVLESVSLGQEPPSLDMPLQNWMDYYNYRGFWLDSPIAGLLHYPLTLYWIIVQWLPQHYLAVFKKMKMSNILQVHIIGAEKEAEMFDPFLECARLLSPIDLHIHLFGDELSKSVHNKCHRKENLTFQVHCGLYHEYTLHELPVPDLVVGFNAGLGAYTTFIKTVHILLDNKTPLICTDYCYYSIVHSQKALSSSHTGKMLKPVINPFRSPFRLVSEELNFPRYSNAFVYCVKPWKPNKKEDDG